MLYVSWLVLSIALVLTLTALRARLLTWTVVSGFLLLAAQLSIADVVLIPWLLWVLLLAFNFPPVRMRLLSNPLRNLLRRTQPAMSETERAALEAGTVWWDAELFSGHPDWGKLLAIPPPNLTEEEQSFLDGPVQELCAMLDDWQINHEHRDLPNEVWEVLKSQGFFGIIIPKSHGGLGFSAQAHSAIVSCIATRSLATAVTVIVPNSLGPAELLMRYGTEGQRDYYLPRLARGEEIPCFALTGPSAGSDAASIPDRGIVCYGEHDGQRKLGLRLSWEKRYITLAPVATVLGLAFRAHDPDGLLGGDSDLGITLALVPTHLPGIEIGRRHYPASQAFQNGPTSGRDVFIPMDWVIGGQERIGQGWRMLLNCLAAGRSISLPATGTAAAKLSARVSGAYARIRKQFGLPIGKFEGIEEPLARIAGQAYALEAARRLTTVALDMGHEPAVLAAIVKHRATEGMRAVLNDAMDLHGGRGICMGPSNYLANGVQSIPVGITVEGANIVTRSMIIFGQGALRCHPWLLREVEAAQANTDAQSRSAFDDALCGHLRDLLSHLSRALLHNLTGGRLIRIKADVSPMRWYQKASLASLNFALATDLVLLSVGGGIKRREKLSGRFADILADLYFISATLKRFEDEGRLEEDRPFLDWVVARGLYAIQDSLNGIFNNMPSRPLAWLLRRLVFPWGLVTKPPSDELGHRIAALLLEPSAVRDRLTQGVFFSDHPDDPIGRLEHALKLTLKAEPIERRCREAVHEQGLEAAQDGGAAAAHHAGLISDTELELLTQTREAVRKAVSVDDFAPEELSPLRAEPARRAAHGRRHMRAIEPGSSLREMP